MMVGLRPVQGVRLDVGQFSHPGQKRSNNEDWLGTFQPEDPERLAKKGSLFLVADGMGGHQSGEMASRRAVDHVIRTYLDDPNDDVTTSLQQAVESANSVLYAEGGDTERGRRWGTTLVAAVVRHDRLWIANVGDSRAYLLRRGKLHQLSRDHTLASSIEDGAPAGEWIGRHIITRALGRKPDVEVDLFPPVKLQVGDRVLLCSDGLTTPLSDEEIQDIAAHYPSQKAVEALVQATNDRGGPDNVSVILIHATGQSTAGRSAWQALKDLSATWTQPETWQQILFREDQGLRSSIFIAIVLLIILALIGLGLALGLVLFSPS